jgi:predicted nucleotidyltransferase
MLIKNDNGGTGMTINTALEQLVPGLQSIYGDLINSIILYGSTARGTRSDDSDVDVALLLHSGATKEMRSQMLDLTVDLELACGKVLSVLCIYYDRFSEWKDTLPFYKNIKKEGVVLWQAA